MAGDRSEIRKSRKAEITGKAAGRLMRAWCATLRFEFIDRCGITRPGGLPGPAIYCLWHDRIFTVPAGWRRSCGGHRRAVVLTSASHDGAALARAMAEFGIGSVRGSSSRRGVAALVGLRKAVREGIDACITPDGPRGPRRLVQPGIVKLAEATGAPIVPIHVEYGSYRELGTWDRFAIPAPGSPVRVIFDRALAVPAGLSEAAFEAHRSRLEQIMRRGAADPSPFSPEITTDLR